MEVLLVGNTDFITKQWIQHAFPRDHVVIAEREGTVDGNDRLRIVNMSDAVTETAIWEHCEDFCMPFATGKRKC